MLSFALLSRDGTCRWFVDRRKVPAGLDLPNAVAVEPVERFHEALAELGRAGSRVMIDRAPRMSAISTAVTAGAQLVEAEDPCVLAKAQKNAVELAGATDAQRRDGAAVARFLAWLDRPAARRQLDEESAAARLEAERAKDPLFRGPSFDAISAHGPNAALPHYRATPESNRPLTGGRST